MLASPRDVKVRRDFRRFVLRFAPRKGTILDFGAGTGIDAKIYAEGGLRVLVYEPCEENRLYLSEHCSEELARGSIAVTDLTPNEGVDAIAANFAVLNLIANPRPVFATFARLIGPEGHIILSLLNPYFLGDARYRWWRTNLGALLCRGSYSVEGEGGAIYRFTQSFMVRTAQPAFRLIALHPRGLELASHPYMFMAFQKT